MSTIEVAEEAARQKEGRAPKKAKRTTGEKLAAVRARWRKEIHRSKHSLVWNGRSLYCRRCKVHTGRTFL